MKRPLVRTLLPLAAVVAAAVLFAMAWQSVGEQSDFAASERDGIRYIQALGPLEIALTNAESAAVSGSPCCWARQVESASCMARV